MNQLSTEPHFDEMIGFILIIIMLSDHKGQIGLIFTRATTNKYQVGKIK